jgi:hypothetical protein
MNTNSKVALAVTADAALGFGSISAGHRFPPPWSVEEQDGCFVVRDRGGQALSYVYFKDDRGRRSVATLFTRDEARHIAAAVAELPARLCKG